MTTMEKRRYFDGFWLGLGIGIAIGSLIVQITAARAQSPTGGCSKLSTAWTSNLENCLSQGGIFTPLPGNVIVQTVTGNNGTSISNHTPKCPEGYSLVYVGRPMCARDLREPE